MSDVTLSGTPMPQAAPRLRPLWARAIALITAPRSVFEELEPRPAWFWTTTVISAFALVLSFLLWEPVIVPYSLDRAEQKGMAAEQIARMEQMYSLPGVHIGAACSAAVVNLGFVILVGLALYGICSFLLGGRASVKQALSVAAHASLVHIPRSLLSIPLIFARQDPTVTLGPGALFPASEATGFAGHFVASFLGGLDLFNLWSLALCALGMSVMSRLPARQVGVAVGVAYLALLVLLSLGGAAFNRG